MGYLIMKLLHILFVVLFLGNIIIGVFWKRHGDKTNNPDEYKQLSKEWDIWGTIATIAPIAAVVLMVLKPY